MEHYALISLSVQAPMIRNAICKKQYGTNNCIIPLTVLMISAIVIGQYGQSVPLNLKTQSINSQNTLKQDYIK